MKPNAVADTYLETFFDYPTRAIDDEGEVSEFYSWFGGDATCRRKTPFSMKALLAFIEGALERMFYPTATDYTVGDRASLASYFRSSSAVSRHANTDTSKDFVKRRAIGSQFVRCADHDTLHNLLKDVYGEFFNDAAVRVDLHELTRTRPDVDTISWSMERFLVDEGKRISPSEHVFVTFPWDTCRMTWDLGLWSTYAIMWDEDDCLVRSKIDFMLRTIGLEGEFHSVGFRDFGDIISTSMPSLQNEIDSNTMKNWFSVCTQPTLKNGPEEMTFRTHLVPFMMSQLMIATMRYLNYTTKFVMAWKRKRTMHTAYYELGVDSIGNMIAVGGPGDPVEEESIGTLEGWNRVTYEGGGFDAIYTIAAPTSCGEDDPMPFLWKSGAEISGMEDVGGGIRRWHVGRAIISANVGEPELIYTQKPFLRSSVDTLVPTEAHASGCLGPVGWPAKKMFDESRILEMTCTAFDGFTCEDGSRLGNVTDATPQGGDWDSAALLLATSLKDAFPGKYKPSDPPEVLNGKLVEKSDAIWADVYADYSVRDGRQFFKDGDMTPYYIPVTVNGAGGEIEPVFQKRIEYKMRVNFGGFPAEDVFGPFDAGPHWEHEHAGCVGTVEFDFKNFSVDYDD